MLPNVSVLFDVATVFFIVGRRRGDGWVERMAKRWEGEWDGEHGKVEEPNTMYVIMT